MYKDKNILAIIPARGGSKGLPKKNIKEMNGLPIPAQLIPQIYYWGVFIVCLCLYFNYAGSDNCNKLLQKNSMAPALLL